MVERSVVQTSTRFIGPVRAHQEGAAPAQPILLQAGDSAGTSGFSENAAIQDLFNQPVEYPGPIGTSLGPGLPAE